MLKARSVQRKRNRGYAGTHGELIAKAVELIAEHGTEALTASALARAVGINRTTIYYHFPNREAMLEAVKEWAVGQLARGFDVKLSLADRVNHVTRFVLDHPHLAKLWIDDLIAPGHVRDSYPYWDQLVTGIEHSLGKRHPDGGFDAEAYAIMFLTSVLVGARVFGNSAGDGTSREKVAKRYYNEVLRVLAHDGF